MDRVVRDGMVAVLISPGFGAGWSTWADAEHRVQSLFDPTVVAWVEAGKVGDVPVDQYDQYFYTGGASDLIVEWVPEGTKFRVHEYDGSEGLILESEEEWFVA